MTTQIAVRLPDHLVEFLDGLVAGGSARSRAHAVTQALLRYEQELSSEHDALIYLQTGDADPELDAWIDHRLPGPLDLD